MQMDLAIELIYCYIQIEVTICMFGLSYILTSYK